MTFFLVMPWFKIQDRILAIPSLEGMISDYFIWKEPHWVPLQLVGILSQQPTWIWFRLQLFLGAWWCAQLVTVQYTLHWQLLFSIHKFLLQFGFGTSMDTFSPFYPTLFWKKKVGTHFLLKKKVGKENFRRALRQKFLSRYFQRLFHSILLEPTFF